MCTGTSGHRYGWPRCQRPTFNPHRCQTLNPHCSPSTVAAGGSDTLPNTIPIQPQVAQNVPELPSPPGLSSLADECAICPVMSPDLRITCFSRSRLLGGAMVPVRSFSSHSNSIYREHAKLRSKRGSILGPALGSLRNLSYTHCAPSSTL